MLRYISHFGWSWSYRSNNKYRIHRYLLRLFTKLTGSTNEIIQMYENMIRAKSGISRLMPIFWTKLQIREGVLAFPKDWEKISIQKGNFKYITKEDKLNKDENDLVDISE